MTTFLHSRLRRRVAGMTLVCLLLFATGAAWPAQAAPDEARSGASTAAYQIAAPVYHIVAKGESLWTIARTYGVTVAVLAALNGNPDPMNIQPGQRLLVSQTAPSWLYLVKLLWPLHGTITSLFGARWGGQHTGLDIAANLGTDIRAALGGFVTVAAWKGNYGRTVIIDHGNGISTLYAHASSLLVETGEAVEPGEVIAKVGSSGRSTGPHVHFEVRVGGHCIDPIQLLH